MPVPSRSLVAVAFTGLFVLLACLAWVAASMTPGPWYDAAVSLAVYRAALVAGASLALVQGIHAFSRLEFIDSTRLWMDSEIARGQAIAASRWDLSVASRGAGQDEASRRVAVLMGLARAGAGSADSPEREGHDALLPRGLPPDLPRQAEPLGTMARERATLVTARHRLWPVLAGPLSAAVVFVAIAAIMVPVSAGLAVADFRLNTALVLFLSYGHGPLLLWTMLALGMS